MTDYVKFFRDTSPYINAHRDKTFVITLAGEALLDRNFGHIVHDIALLYSLGVKIVLVHGAKPQIDAKVTQSNLQTRFAHLLSAQSDAIKCRQEVRITDNETMDCVKDAIGSIGIAIASMLSMSLPNSPMQGARIPVISGNFIVAKPLGVRDGIDFQQTGEVRRVDRAGITRQLDNGAIVLLSPLGYSPTGEVFNLTCEDVATQTAITLGAEKLICFCTKSGIHDDVGRLIKTINMVDVHRQLSLLDDQPQLQSALQAGYNACLNGVSRSHIISYSEDGALLQELFTREGAGTLITHIGGEITRQATIDDVGGILELIAPLEDLGVLVKRSRELLETEISQFQVLVHAEGMIVACAALYPFAGHTSGELACVVTHPDFHNNGFAARLLAGIEQRAKNDLGLEKLFVLTTQAAHWFKEQGFEESRLEELPTEKATLYNLQRNSKILVKSI